MFHGPGPRVFALPLGLDFASELIRGLEERLADAPPEAWGRITIYVPDPPHAGAACATCSTRGPARMVPRLRLVSDVALDPAGADLPPPVSALRRRLELSQLIAALLAQEPELAPARASSTCPTAWRP
jgi:inactivated superfamily I helicase